MRTQSHYLLAVCATVMLALPALAACAPAPTPVPSHTAAATDAPVFASDEEALAAAKKAYAAYLAASDASWAGHSTTRDAFLALSVGDAHEGDVAAAQLFDDNGWRKIGLTSFDSMRLQLSGRDDDGNWEVRTYLCLDVRESDVVNAAGTSVSKANRPLRLPLAVAFVTDANSDLLISESEVWSGSDYC